MVLFFMIYYFSRVGYAGLTLQVRILADIPICALQNMGWTDKKQAHFSPLRGETIHRFRCRILNEKKIINESLGFEIIVVSDFGGAVERIDEYGKVKWRRMFNNPRGISRDQSTLMVGDQDKLYILSLETGEVIKSYSFPFIISKARVYEGKIWILTNDLKSSVQLFSERNGRLIMEKKYEDVGKYARDFEIDSKFIYIAGTYNHKISQYSKTTGLLINDFDSFYPNSVQIIGGQSVLVSEEHMNSIAKFDFLKMERLVMHSCATGSGITDLNDLRLKANKPIDEKGESPCRINKEDFNDKNIFSPNDAISVTGGVLVADTDNHRIVYFEKVNEKIKFMYGFNSPVSVVVLEK